MSEKSLQETYGPRSICFGCGPANDQGLGIRSFPSGDQVVADWTPEPKHQAFPGVLNGGIIGTLLDCHMNWTASYTLMKQSGAVRAPTTVTAEFAVKLQRPAPSGRAVHLAAHAVEVSGNKVTVEATLEAGGKVCATGRGVFVAVKPGHPAYDRW